MFARLRSVFAPRPRTMRKDDFACDTLRMQAYRIASGNLYS